MLTLLAVVGATLAIFGILHGVSWWSSPGNDRRFLAAILLFALSGLSLLLFIAFVAIDIRRAFYEPVETTLERSN